MLERVDAAIVGGGPAGAIIARRLALDGWRVMLIERGSPGRPKACGHCLSRRALSILREEGLLECVRGLAQGTTTTLCVHEGAGSAATWTLADRSHEAGWIVPRETLDQLLRDAAAEAGAIVLHDASARLTALDSIGATLRVMHSQDQREARCALLVGADGVGSGIARAAGLANRRSAGRKYGFAFDLDAVASATAFPAGSIEMFLVHGGYLGAARMNSGAVHFAALVDADDAAQLAGPSAFVRSAACRHPALRSLREATRFEVRAVGPMPWNPLRAAIGQVALVGDAAGYVEPFTGEGIGWALRSAQLLHRAIGECGGAWNAGSADMYAAMWHAEVRNQQRACRWIARVVERPLAVRWVLRANALAPRLAQRLVQRMAAA